MDQETPNNDEWQLPEHPDVHLSPGDGGSEQRAGAGQLSPSENGPEQVQRRTGPRQVARVLLLIGSLSIAALGLLVGGLGAVVGLVDVAADTLTTLTFSISFLLLCVVLGLALAWQAWQSLRGKASIPFQPPPVWPWILIFPVLILAGQLTLALGPLSALVFPLLHVAASVLPSLIIVAAVGRGLPGIASRREVVLQLGSGAFVSTVLALILEVGVVLGLAILVLGVVAMQPGGLELVQSLADFLEDPTWLQDPTALVPLATSPLVVLGALLVFAGLIPLLEEMVKTVGVPLLVYRRPSLARAFLWGTASGAGFALAEGMFNATGGLDAWAFVISLRVGATLLHCFTGALVGIAWYYALIERRWFRAGGLFVGAWALHSIWNGLAALVTVLSLASMDGQADEAMLGLAGLGTAGSMVVLVLMAVGVAVGFVLLTRQIKKRTVQKLSTNNIQSLTKS